MKDLAIDDSELIATVPQRSRVLAVITGRNEERHVRPLFSFYSEQGIDVAYIDQRSTDGTLELALEYLGDPLVLVASSPFRGNFSMSGLLRTKESLMRQVPHEWVMHTDMDEYRLGVGGSPLLETIDQAESQGFNAVNFQEFTFVPVVDAPDHDHARYRNTMHWYYAFSPRPRHRLNAFMPRKLPDFDLVTEAGHRIRSQHLHVLDTDLVMEHYVFLSPAHFREKYIGRRFSDEDIERGWHGNRRDLIEPSLSSSTVLHDQRTDGYTTRNPLSEHPWVTQPDTHRA